MYNKELLKEIISFTEERNILKTINKITRIDYNKEFKLYKLKTPFTVKSIIKNYGKDNSSIFVFIYDNNASHFTNENILKVAYINQNTNKCEIDDNINIDSHNTCFRKSKCCRPFRRKLDFERLRKENTLTYVFVVDKLVQNKIKAEKYLSYVNSYKESLLDRFKLVREYYNSVELEVIGQPSSNWFRDRETNDIELRTYDVSKAIDKSGYIVSHKQNYLRNTVSVIKADRNKIALDNFIKSAEYKELLKNFENSLEHIQTNLALFMSSISLTNKLERTIEELQTIENFMYRYVKSIKNYKTFLENPKSLYGNVSDLVNYAEDEIDSIKFVYKSTFSQIPILSSFTPLDDKVNWLIQNCK